MLPAQQMYERAIAEDPEFAEAYAGLGFVHTVFYWYDIDQNRTAERRAQAESAITTALELDPELPEAHVAWANYLYRCLGKYNEALEAFAIAENLDPDDADIYLLRSSIRRLGRWNQAIADQERALMLEPDNLFYLRQQHVNYLNLRDYTRAGQYLDQVLLLAPDDATAYVDKVALALYRDGDTTLARQYDDEPPIPRYVDGDSYAWARWLAAIRDRDYPTALRVLQAVEGELIRAQGSLRSKALFFARTYKLVPNEEQARTYLERAIAEFHRRLDAAAVGDVGPTALLDLAEAQAGLGEQSAALGSLARARALTLHTTFSLGSSTEVDTVLGVLLPLGEKEQALKALDDYFRAPGIWSMNGLEDDPRLDSIREDPGFVALVSKHRR